MSNKEKRVTLACTVMTGNKWTDLFSKLDRNFSLYGVFVGNDGPNSGKRTKDSGSLDSAYTICTFL